MFKYLIFTLINYLSLSIHDFILIVVIFISCTSMKCILIDTYKMVEKSLHNNNYTMSQF